MTKIVGDFDTYSFKDFCDVLGLKVVDLWEVEEDVFVKRVRSAYRKMSLKLHPDKNNGDEGPYKTFCNAVDFFLDINNRRNLSKNASSSREEKQENVTEFPQIESGERLYKFILNNCRTHKFYETLSRREGGHINAHKALFNFFESCGWCNFNWPKDETEARNNFLCNLFMQGSLKLITLLELNDEQQEQLKEPSIVAYIIKEAAAKDNYLGVDYELTRLSQISPEHIKLLPLFDRGFIDKKSFFGLSGYPKKLISYQQLLTRTENGGDLQTSSNEAIKEECHLLGEELKGKYGPFPVKSGISLFNLKSMYLPFPDSLFGLSLLALILFVVGAIAIYMFVSLLPLLLSQLTLAGIPFVLALFVVTLIVTYPLFHFPQEIILLFKEGFLNVTFFWLPAVAGMVGFVFGGYLSYLVCPLVITSLLAIGMSSFLSILIGGVSTSILLVLLTVNFLRQPLHIIQILSYMPKTLHTLRQLPSGYKTAMPIGYLLGSAVGAGLGIYVAILIAPLLISTLVSVGISHGIAMFIAIAVGVKLPMTSYELFRNIGLFFGQLIGQCLHLSSKKEFVRIEKDLSFNNGLVSKNNSYAIFERSPPRQHMTPACAVLQVTASVACSLPIKLEEAFEPYDFDLYAEYTRRKKPASPSSAVDNQQIGGNHEIMAQS